MKKSILISTLSTVLCLISANVIAAGGHGDHGSSVNKSGKSACLTTKIKHVRPEHLASVSPKSEISFQVEGLEDPKYVEVTAKKFQLKCRLKAKVGFYGLKEIYLIL